MARHSRRLTGRARLGRCAPGVAALALALGLTACGGSPAGTPSARKACTLVTRAARFEHLAAAAVPSEARRLRDRARLILERAEPLAAGAAAADANWQALMANLGEIPANPPSLVLPALRMDCSQVGKI